MISCPLELVATQVKSPFRSVSPQIPFFPKLSLKHIKLSGDAFRILEYKTLPMLSFEKRVMCGSHLIKNSRFRYANQHTSLYSNAHYSFVY